MDEMDLVLKYFEIEQKEQKMIASNKMLNENSGIISQEKNNKKIMVNKNQVDPNQIDELNKNNKKIIVLNQNGETIATVLTRLAKHLLATGLYYIPCGGYLVFSRNIELI